MYTKEEASAIRQAFWKAFGHYMALQVPADGGKVNWINYKTGIRYLSFKMEADNKRAVIMIEMNHPDPGIQELMFEQFRALQHLLAEHLGETWQWSLHAQEPDGKTVSRIALQLDKVNIYRQEEWPDLVSFFKPRMMALDRFWSEAQYGFELFQ